MKADEEDGMKLGLAGLALALVGAGFAFTVLPRVGYWLALAGILLGFAGMALHWYKNWRQILGVDRD